MTKTELEDAAFFEVRKSFKRIFHPNSDEWVLRYEDEFTDIIIGLVYDYWAEKKDPPKCDIQTEQELDEYEAAIARFANIFAERIQFKINETLENMKNPDHWR